MKFLVFDTETTGLPKRYNASPEETYLFPYIVQLSWLVYDTGNNKLESINDKIIKLPTNIQIPQRATEIHGITQEQMLTDGESITEVLDTFLRDVSLCTYIVAHNINFDKKMVEVECIRNKLKKRLSSYRKFEYCTMHRGKDICKLAKINHNAHKEGYKLPKLIELHKRLFNDTPENLHNSLIDVLVCFRCFYALVYNVDVTAVNSEFKTYYENLCK